METTFSSKKISIQTIIRKGIPTIKILGIPTQKSTEISIKLQTILISNQLNLPYENIQINLTPSGIKQYNHYLDLSLLVSLLLAIDPALVMIENSLDALDTMLFLGEVNLFGEIEYSESLTSIIIHAYKKGFRRIFLPYNCIQHTLFLDDLEFYPIFHIKDLINQNYKKIKGKKFLSLPSTKKRREVQIPQQIVNTLPIILSGKHPTILFENQKLNKSSLLEQIEYLLPELNEEESLEILLYNPNLSEPRRPLTKINSSIQNKEFLGDSYDFGILLKTLNGILFLEDINLFDKKIILFLKELLEKNEAFIYKKNLESLNIKNKFWIFLSTQTCPCGNFLNPLKVCTCSQKAIFEYMKKFITFLKYQIEIYLHISNLNFVTMKENEILKTKQKIDKAIEIQKNRFSNENFSFNAQIPLERVYDYCILDSKESEEWLENIIDTSNYDYEKKLNLKVARTIADLEESTLIKKHHIIQAIQIRKLITLYEEPILKKTLFVEKK